MRRKNKDQEILQMLLRKLRLDAEIRQQELADKLGHPQSFVSKYETGERRLDILELREICESIGVSFRKFTAMLDSQISGEAAAAAEEPGKYEGRSK